MAESLRCLLASAGLGAVACRGSEAMFRGFPPPGQDPAGMFATGCACAFAAACALSLTTLTGVRGLAAPGLGGAVLGFVAEGGVGTMYENFPWQMVWRPLAWHRPVTALAVFGLNRRLQGAAAWRHAGAFIGVGLRPERVSGRDARAGRARPLALVSLARLAPCGVTGPGDRDAAGVTRGPRKSGGRLPITASFVAGRRGRPEHGRAFWIRKRALP